MSMLENWLYLLQSFGFNPKQFDQRNLGYIQWNTYTTNLRSQY